MKSFLTSLTVHVHNYFRYSHVFTFHMLEEFTNDQCQVRLIAQLVGALHPDPYHRVMTTHQFCQVPYYRGGRGHFLLHL